MPWVQQYRREERFICFVKVEMEGTGKWGRGNIKAEEVDEVGRRGHGERGEEQQFITHASRKGSSEYNMLTTC